MHITFIEPVSTIYGKSRIIKRGARYIDIKQGDQELYNERRSSKIFPNLRNRRYKFAHLPHVPSYDGAIPGERMYTHCPGKREYVPEMPLPGFNYAIVFSCLYVCFSTIVWSFTGGKI